MTEPQRGPGCPGSSALAPCPVSPRVPAPAHFLGMGRTPSHPPSPAVDRSSLRGSDQKLGMCFHTERFLSKVSSRLSSLRGLGPPAAVSVGKQPAPHSDSGACWESKLLAQWGGRVTQPHGGRKHPAHSETSVCNHPRQGDRLDHVAVALHLTHYSVTYVLTVLWLYFKEVGQCYSCHLCPLEVCFPTFSEEEGLVMTVPCRQRPPVKGGVAGSLCGGQARARAEV